MKFIPTAASDCIQQCVSHKCLSNFSQLLNYITCLSLTALVLQMEAYDGVDSVRLTIFDLQAIHQHAVLQVQDTTDLSHIGHFGNST